MVGIVDCKDCKHKRLLLNSCCGDLSNGCSRDFDCSKVKELKGCNNGIGFKEN